MIPNPPEAVTIPLLSPRPAPPRASSVGLRQLSNLDFGHHRRDFIEAGVIHGNMPVVLTENISVFRGVKAGTLSDADPAEAAAVRALSSASAASAEEIYSLIFVVISFPPWTTFRPQVLFPPRRKYKHVMKIFKNDAPLCFSWYNTR
jgi:hypothetical protein